MDDSAYREFSWANYATGLGASLHELGHTFDLAHTPSGIMARGFDDLNKVFTVHRSKVSGENHYGNHERSPSTSSLASSVEGSVEGQTQLPEPKVNSLSERRYKVICNGSPFRKPPVRRNSGSSNVYIAPPPVVFKFETNFRPAVIHQTVITVRNYDGSETYKTIKKGRSYETVSEITLGESGELLSKTEKRVNTSVEMRKAHGIYLPTERHTSTSSNSSSLSHSSQSPIRVIPSRLPNYPTETELKFPSRIKSSNGLRLVELRREQDGVVFHHWEFLSETPPTEFTLKLSRVKNLPVDATLVTVVAEDNERNVLKKRQILMTLSFNSLTSNNYGCPGYAKVKILPAVAALISHLAEDDSIFVSTVEPGLTDILQYHLKLSDKAMCRYSHVSDNCGGFRGHVVKVCDWQSLAPHLCGFKITWRRSDFQVRKVTGCLAERRWFYPGACPCSKKP